MRFLAASLFLVLAACAQASSFGPKVRPVSMEQLKAAAPSGQLSGVAQPVAYRVEMTVDPRETDFSGHVQIDINLMTSATGIWMHGADLNVSSVLVTAGGETRPASWTEVDPNGVAWVGFPNRVHAGGITHLRRIAALADLHRIRTGCHGATDLSPVTMAAALHFDLSIPNFGIQEYMRHTAETDAVFPQAYSFDDGMLHPGDEPGLGVDIDEEFVAAHPSAGNVAVPIGRDSKSYADGTFDEHVYVQTRRARARYFNPDAD